ncbi:hypothetical protein SAY86_030635 [Trapa natans]|uniref:Uncharacterized protein n=1 Tax=Trapa natans TaxID=22666 RepID=A0AAN7M438_TRANT|nr:hypothetical protein SAY86_030635 [Trapa natans]
MAPPQHFLLLILLLALISPSLCQSQHFPGTLIDCGAASSSLIDGREWLPDEGFTSSGVSRSLTETTNLKILSTVRSFPLHDRKFCYTVSVIRDARYMIRSTYFYGGVNVDSPNPPVFDQMVDGTLWSVVNTTENYARGNLSYYEGVFRAQGKTMIFCIGANSYTDSDPFISALEFIKLENSLYNSTNFVIHSLSLVARHAFGSTKMIGYPDDQFGRYWHPFGQEYSSFTYNNEISVSGIWNLPPLAVFKKQLSTPLNKSMEIQWPPFSLQNTTYYIALYFADDLGPASDGGPRRAIDISINGMPYYSNMSVTSIGGVVFTTWWPLSGITKLKIAPAMGSVVGPLINAGEIFQVLQLGRRTHTKDVIALEKIRNNFQNPPPDWTGDPCMPQRYSWTGVTCYEGRRIRIVALNLTSTRLSGSLSPALNDLTALTSIALGNNHLSGTIPNLSGLKLLEILHLNDNQFTGEIPPSLGDISKLRELFLQNNNLSGPVPNTLLGKPRLNFKYDGNNVTTAPPSP